MSNEAEAKAAFDALPATTEEEVILKRMACRVVDVTNAMKASGDFDDWAGVMAVMQTSILTAVAEELAATAAVARKQTAPAPNPMTAIASTEIEAKPPAPVEGDLFEVDCAHTVKAEPCYRCPDCGGTDFEPGEWTFTADDAPSQVAATCKGCGREVVIGVCVSVGDPNEGDKCST